LRQIRKLVVKWNEYLATTGGRLVAKSYSEDWRELLPILAERYNKYPSLEEAAQEVVKNWESGDLAGAVQNLQATLDQ
jgi:hypothetical protein